MTDTFFIPSAAYIQPNMQTEFGRIPPCFLPLRTGVLLDEQVQTIGESVTQRLLSLPADFRLEPWQEERIERYGFEVIRPPTGLSLGASVSFALNAAPKPVGRLRLLHGDTLIIGMDTEEADRLTVHSPDSAGYWARIDAGEPGKLQEKFFEDTSDGVLSGYFDFADGRAFLRALALADGDFVQGVALYGGDRPLRNDCSGRWYDFGRLETYFLSRRAFGSERHFNDLRFDRYSVCKRSFQKLKIIAERRWFDEIPAPLKLFTPTLLGVSDDEASAGYEIEYLPQCSLSELFVFSALPLQQWRRIALAASDFLVLCRQYEGGQHDPRLLYADKTWSRLSAYCEQTGIDLDTPFFVNGNQVGSLREVVERALLMAAPQSTATVMHGDYCFSNILFDSRLGLLRAIDPRGGIDISKPSIYGDPDYDVAKLYHSFSGGYDLILAGHYRYRAESPYELAFDLIRTQRQKEVAAVFETTLAAAGLPTGARPIAMTVLLFLSLLPLHADRPDRQAALFTNALWIFSTISG